MKYLLLIILSLSIQSTYSQLYMGSDGMTVKANEVLHFDGLTLTPSADLTLTSTTLTKTEAYTISPAPSGTYIKRYFSFSSTTPTFSGTIRFPYLGADLNGIAEGDLRLNIRTNGTVWTSRTDAPNTTDGYIESASLSSTLNTLTLARLTNPLPVTWLSFTAEKKGTSALLKWSTASELNTKDFEVQHSTNTQNWTSIGTVAAAGNSSSTLQYSFSHLNPIKGRTYNFYRILQRDLDDKYSYSKIASLIYDEAGADMIVYPNPANESVTIYLAESKEVRLVNAVGATVWSGTLSAGRNLIPLTTVTRGMYWIVAGTAKKQLLIQ